MHGNVRTYVHTYIRARSNLVNLQSKEVTGSMWHVGYETARHAVACMCVCKFAHTSDDYMRQIPKELRIGEY